MNINTNNNSNNISIQLGKFRRILFLAPSLLLRPLTNFVLRFFVCRRMENIEEKLSNLEITPPSEQNQKKKKKNKKRNSQDPNNNNNCPDNNTPGAQVHRNLESTDPLEEHKRAYQNTGNLFEYYVMKGWQRLEVLHQPWMGEDSIERISTLPKDIRPELYKFLHDTDTYKLMKHFQLDPTQVTLTPWNSIGFISATLLYNICRTKQVNIMFTHCQGRYLFFKDFNLPLYFLNSPSCKNISNFFLQQIDFDHDVIKKHKQEIRTRAQDRDTEEEFDFIDLRNVGHYAGSRDVEFLLNLREKQ
mmetsp:Transcript_5679/g.7942  ORF Transcript_5679/g.7942 Transcript_5679/m.7942 type:complete len:302 (+) Transcript_5679:619-1524(+)